MTRGVKCTIKILDGMNTDKDIVEHLSVKYRKLFSSQKSSHCDIDDAIQDKVTYEGNAFVVTVTEVDQILSKLNRQKSDGMRGTYSDHFIYAPHRLTVLLTMLINVMFMHGHMADELLSSVLVSIPKDARGSLTNSDNYRAIALFSAIGKVIDMLVIERCSEQLMTSSSQFAFKSNHSTSMCTNVVK